MTDSHPAESASRIPAGLLAGRTALVAQKEAGVPRKLVGLEVTEHGTFDGLKGNFLLLESDEDRPGFIDHIGGHIVGYLDVDRREIVTLMTLGARPEWLTLGYLPGTMEEKMSPYLRPLYDALCDRLSTKRLKSLIAEGVAEAEAMVAAAEGPVEAPAH